MTKFERKVLDVARRHRWEGPIEVAMSLYGCPSHLEMYNVNRAITALHSDGYLDIGHFVLTDKGNASMEEGFRCRK